MVKSFVIISNAAYYEAARTGGVSINIKHSA